MAVSIGFAVNQEVCGGWGPWASSPKPLGSLGLQFRFHVVLFLFGFNLCMPVFLSLSCALIMTSKSNHVFFKSEEVNKCKSVWGVQAWGSGRPLFSPWPFSDVTMEGEVEQIVQVSLHVTPGACDLVIHNKNYFWRTFLIPIFC